MLPRDDAYENTYDEKHEMDETRGAGRRAQEMGRIIGVQRPPQAS